MEKLVNLIVLLKSILKIIKLTHVLMLERGISTNLQASE